MKTCPSCNKEIEGQFNFCPHCGYKDATADQKISPTQGVINDTNKKQSSTSLFTQPAQRLSSGRAKLACILGVLSLFCGFVFSIPAVILGWMELKAIESGKSPYIGKKLAQIGYVLGIISIVLFFAAFVYNFSIHGVAGDSVLQNLLTGMGLLLLATVVVCAYFIPTAIAVKRGHPNCLPIVLINIFAGWIYGIGWLVAIVWACSAIDRNKQCR